MEDPTNNHDAVSKALKIPEIVEKILGKLCLKTLKVCRLVNSTWLALSGKMLSKMSRIALRKNEDLHEFRQAQWINKDDFEEIWLQGLTIPPQTWQAENFTNFLNNCNASTCKIQKLILEHKDSFLTDFKVVPKFFSNLKRLEITCHVTTFIIDVSLLSKIDHLELNDCILDLVGKVIPKPKIIILKDIEFKNKENVSLNKFFNFQNSTLIDIQCGFVPIVSINLSEAQKLHSIKLRQVNIVNDVWKAENANLQFFHDDFSLLNSEITNLKIDALEANEMPLFVKKLHLEGAQCPRGNVDLNLFAFPHLEHLILSTASEDYELELIKNFQRTNCPVLKTLEINAKEYLKFPPFPNGIPVLKLNNRVYFRRTTERFRVHTLVLDYYEFSAIMWSPLLRRFLYQELIVRLKPSVAVYDGFVKEVKRIPKVVIGPILYNPDKPFLVFDPKFRYFEIEYGQVRGIDKNEYLSYWNGMTFYIPTMQEEYEERKL